MSTVEPNEFDVLKCKFVVTEIPKIFPPHKRFAAIFADVRAIVVDHPASKMALYARSACDGDIKVDMTDKKLEAFLMGLTQEGLDVEKEYDEAVWSFLRVSE